MAIKMEHTSISIVLMDIITVLLGLLIFAVNLFLFDTNKNNIDKKN